MFYSKRVLTLMPGFIQNGYASFKRKRQLIEWKRQGRSIPVPHVVKQELILKYKEKHATETLVESGTYFGDMVWAQKNNFNKIYSIELNKELSEFATKRFKKDNHISIIQGDSGKIMPILVRDLKEKTLFWLDGHFSAGITSRGDKDCPVAEEVKAILSTSSEHIIIISNARNYIGQRDYPTLEGLSKYILKHCPQADIHVEDDCIVVELKPKQREDIKEKEEEEDV